MVRGHKDTLLLAAAAAVLAAAVHSVSAAPRGTLLAVLADPADRAGRFGPFFDGLEAAGWALDVRPAKPASDGDVSPIKLKDWDTWAYEGAVILPGSTNGAPRTGAGGGRRNKKQAGGKEAFKTRSTLSDRFVCVCVCVSVGRAGYPRIQRAVHGRA